MIKFQLRTRQHLAGMSKMHIRMHVQLWTSLADSEQCILHHTQIAHVLCTSQTATFWAGPLKTILWCDIAWKWHLITFNLHGSCCMLSTQVCLCVFFSRVSKGRNVKQLLQIGRLYECCQQTKRSAGLMNFWALKALHISLLWFTTESLYFRGNNTPHGTRLGFIQNVLLSFSLLFIKENPNCINS